MHAAVDRDFRLLNMLAPRWQPRLAFFIVGRRRFPRCTGDFSVLAQTFPVRLPDDVSILRVVTDLISIYPLSK